MMGKYLLKREPEYDWYCIGDARGQVSGITNFEGWVSRNFQPRSPFRIKIMETTYEVTPLELFR